MANRFTRAIHDRFPNHGSKNQVETAYLGSNRRLRANHPHRKASGSDENDLKHAHDRP
jgi:hypothetical protein